MSRVVILETMRRHFTSILFVALALATVTSAIAAAHMQPGAIWTGLVFLVAIVCGAEVLGPEFSSGTLQLVLTKPVNRSVYVTSRVTGAVLTTWLVALGAAVTEAVARMFVAGGRDTNAVFIAGLNSALEAILICSLLAFFGSFLRAYFNVAMFFLLQVFFSGALSALMILRGGKRGFWAAVGRFLTANPWVAGFVAWLERNMFPDRPGRVDPEWMLLIACNATLALVGACLVYRRREVPYGAD